MSTALAVQLFTAIAVIALLARVAGAVARRLGQPAVVGEIVAGVLFGRTVAHGAVASVLFPAQVRPLLGGFADLGVALLMFLVGLELEPGAARGSNRNVVGVAAGSIALPLAAGAVLGLLWQPRDPGHVLFVAVALSVTAFPVLVRILEDRELIRTPLGRLAVISAATCDVAVWLLLALATLLAAGHISWRLLMLPLFIVSMFAVVRPLFRRLLARTDIGGADLVLICAGLLASCAATEWMGLHFIFGAFLFGMAVAGCGGFAGWAAALRRDIEPLGVRLLMPVYFVVAGWQVDLTRLTASDWLAVVAVTGTAAVAKFGGSCLGARLTGLGTRQSVIVGLLMNTRGLTELIVLTTGRQLGILDVSHYTVLVVMALITTIATGPLLTLVAGQASQWAEDLGDRPDRAPALAGAGPARSSKT